MARRTGKVKPKFGTGERGKQETVCAPAQRQAAGRWGGRVWWSAVLSGEESSVFQTKSAFRARTLRLKGFVCGLSQAKEACTCLLLCVRGLRRRKRRRERPPVTKIAFRSLFAFYGRYNRRIMKHTIASPFAPGLTTTQAPFIENARRTGQLFVEQPYDLYSEGNHRAWRELYARMRPRWERFAHPRFLEGVESLSIPAARVPRLEEINQFLQPRTQFTARGVSGYIPAFLFFGSLGRRHFPTTITIRSESSLDYLPEPDIFHDIAGHVPMHTDVQFADTLVKFGKCADTAAEVCREISDPEVRRARFASMMRAMARFFWFTIEFGLMQTEVGVKAYGSGLLSSYGELKFAVQSPDVQRVPLQLDWVINQGFDIDHYQPLVFVAESFGSLYEMVGVLDNWMREGRLNNVATGEPVTKAEEIDEFLRS